jgi:methionyl-tRNA formyltransferase
MAVHSAAEQAERWRRSATNLTCGFVGDSTMIIRCAQIVSSHGFRTAAVLSDDPKVRTKVLQRGLTSRAAPAEEDAIGELASEVDLLFFVAHTRRVGPDVLDRPPYGCVNFHDAPLPRYAGRNATSWALLSGEESHGVTWHLMVDRVDEGPILMQQRVAIEPGDTSGDLNLRCYVAGIDAFARLAGSLLDGRVEPRAQDLSKRTYFSSVKRAGARAILRWDGRTVEVLRVARALDFGRSRNPLGYPKVLTPGGALFVSGITEAADEATRPPGTVVSVRSGEGVTISTSDGHVRLRSWRDLSGRHLGTDDLGILGVAEGVTLPRLSSRAEAAIDAVTSQAAPHENRWLGPLERCTVALGPPLDDPPLPEKRFDLAGGTTIHTSRRPGIPASVWTMAGGVLAVMARQWGHQRFAVGVRNAGTADRTLHTDGLFVPVVGLECTVEARPTLSTAQRLGGQVRDALELPTALSRDALLQTGTGAWRGDWPVVITNRFDLGEPPITGTVATIVVVDTGDGGGTARLAIRPTKALERYLDRADPWDVIARELDSRATARNQDLPSDLDLLKDVGRAD